MTGERRRWKNILWPEKLHQNTRKLIAKYPILNANFKSKEESKAATKWQDFELEIEIGALEWDEDNYLHWHSYYPLSASNYTYKKELLQAREQLKKLM
jgi:hypothetical protein